MILIVTGTFASALRHFTWLMDTIWAGPCIVFPDFMDKMHTKRFLKKFEDDTMTELNPLFKTVGIVLVMGAQNAGCHLVYETLMDKLTKKMKKKGVNVVWEVNRWARDGPMDHADKSLAPKRAPPNRLKFGWIRRLVGDYIGIPILFLGNAQAVISVDKSVHRLAKKLATLDGETEITLMCHSLGGPVAYRYLQAYPTANVSKIFTVGSMNHFTNIHAGLGGDSHINQSPFFPVRVPHLDVLDGADFLSFPFYQTHDCDDQLPKGDGEHYTFWIEEKWMPGVFAHTGYAHCRSFYNAVTEFLIGNEKISKEKKRKRGGKEEKENMKIN